MRRSEVKTAIAYYFGIPAMRAELARERAELEGEYNSMRGTSYDAAPHGSSPGKPVEELTVRLEERQIRARLEEIAVKDRVLVMDRDVIQGCLDQLGGRYKKLIFERHRDRCSWAKLAVRYGKPDSTVRWWYDSAVERLGEALEEVPMYDEILARASRARV